MGSIGMRSKVVQAVAVLLVAMGMLVGTGFTNGRSVSAGQGDGGYIITGNTYLRAKPNSKSAAVKRLKAGSLVIAEGPLAGKSGGTYRWVYVSWMIQGDQAEGWAIASKLTRFSSSDGNAVTTANVNLRAAPNQSAEIYLVIPSGTDVNVLNWTEVNGYVRVEYSYIEGYVHADYLGGMD